MFTPCNFNLHTHTVRCHHATGEDEEYVLKAIENGYKTIGFSDHAPYVFPKSHYSGFRMERELAEGYRNSVLALKEKYRDKIDIKLGFEVEWYPLFIEEELKYLKGLGAEYLICGQHYTMSEVESEAKYTGSKTTDKETFDRYIEQVIAAAKSGEFIYIAHPDLINFTGDRDYYIERMTYLLKTLKEIDIPIEFNFLGFSDGRNYPNDEFWRLAAEIKNRVVIGLDAHAPEVYENREGLERLYNKLSSFGIEPIRDVNEIIK